MLGMDIIPQAYIGILTPFQDQGTGLVNGDKKIGIPLGPVVAVVILHPVDQLMILAKFWIHISREEQLARFEARRDTPYKSWKLTDEDWRKVLDINIMPSVWTARAVIPASGPSVISTP